MNACGAFSIPSTIVSRHLTPAFSDPLPHVGEELWEPVAVVADDEALEQQPLAYG